MFTSLRIPMTMKHLLFTLLVFSPALHGQATADPGVLAEALRIKAIDNHSHPPKLVVPGERDDDFDALPCDPISQMDAPFQTRPENPQFLKAWKALWSYPYNDLAPVHVAERPVVVAVVHERAHLARRVARMPFPALERGVQEADVEVIA